MTCHYRRVQKLKNEIKKQKKYSKTLMSYAKVNEDKEKDADIMGHSLQTQSDYVKQ